VVLLNLIYFFDWI